MLKRSGLGGRGGRARATTEKSAGLTGQTLADGAPTTGSDSQRRHLPHRRHQCPPLTSSIARSLPCRCLTAAVSDVEHEREWRERYAHPGWRDLRCNNAANHRHPGTFPDIWDKPVICNTIASERNITSLPSLAVFFPSNSCAPSGLGLCRGESVAAVSLNRKMDICLYIYIYGDEYGDRQRQGDKDRDGDRETETETETETGRQRQGFASVILNTMSAQSSHRQI